MLSGLSNANDVTGFPSGNHINLFKHSFFLWQIESQFNILCTSPDLTFYIFGKYTYLQEEY